MRVLSINGGRLFGSLLNNPSDQYKLYVVKNMRTAIALALALMGCATSPLDGAPSVVGVWRVLGLGADGSTSIVGICKGTLEFRPDGTSVSRSDKQTITARYSIHAENGSFVLSQRDMSGNGEKNCQDLSSDFVIEHTPSDVRILISGDTLKLYPKSTGTFVAFTRTSEK